MQIVSIGDKMHGVQNPFFFFVFFFSEKYEKYFNMSSAEKFTQSAKC